MDLSIGSALYPSPTLPPRLHPPCPILVCAAAFAPHQDPPWTAQPNSRPKQLDKPRLFTHFTAILSPVRAASALLLAGTPTQLALHATDAWVTNVNTMNTEEAIKEYSTFSAHCHPTSIIIN